MSGNPHDDLAAALAALLNEEQGRTWGLLTADEPVVRELAVALAAGLPYFADVVQHRFGTVALVFERGEVARVEALFSHKPRRLKRAA